MNGIDDLIASFTARQHGLIARWQALGVGISADQVKDRITRGQLVPVHPGVYRLRGVPFTQELRWLAAVLAGGDGAVLSHQAAGVLHHFDLRRVKPVVSTPHSRHPEIDGVTWHRTRRHTGLDIITINKIPVTTRARAMLDCAAVLPLSVLELLVQDAVSRGLLEVEHLMAIVDRRGGRGVDGTVNLRLALENGLVDDKIESKLELIVARIIDPLPIPKPVRQFELTCDDGREVRLDNAWPDRKVTTELPDGLSLAEGDARRSGRPGGSAKGGAASPFAQSGWSEATETPLDVRLEVERAVLGPIRGRRAA